MWPRGGFSIGQSVIPPGTAAALMDAVRSVAANLFGRFSAVALVSVVGVAGLASVGAIHGHAIGGLLSFGLVASAVVSGTTSSQ